MKLLLARVKELEKKIEYLRVSRRVLMDLVLYLQQDKEKKVKELLEENRRLRKAKHKYAQALWLKNQQIIKLSAKETSKG